MSANNVNYFNYPPPAIPNISNSVYTSQPYALKQQHQHLQSDQQRQQSTQLLRQQSHYQQCNWENQSYLENIARQPLVPPFPPPTLITNQPPPPFPSLSHITSQPPPIHSTHITSQPPPLPCSRTYHLSSPSQRNFIPRGRYNTSTSQNLEASSYKRTKYNDDSSETRSKTTKKKKKSLSQLVPKKKNFTREDAERVFNIEQEYNKRFKNHSLIIKFPDEELNKDMVFKFHEAIENVHFQQPSNARFCFVTLKESADADAVIAALNKQKFGNGYLSVEYKKDREEDILGPSNIDPLTLYVGNLSQEITKADLTSTYPDNRRVDIGFARKMKHTRYAFVSFYNVEDAIKAFLNTRNTDIYSKSLIVRFRRLCATTAASGEMGRQNLLKSPTPISTGADTLDPDSYSREQEAWIPTSDYSLPNETSPLPDLDVPPDTDDTSTVDAGSSTVKTEPLDDEDRKPCINTDYESPFAPGPVDAKFVRHKPKIKTEIKTEIKIEKKEVHDDELASVSSFTSDVPIKQERSVSIEIKEEPNDDLEEFDFQKEYNEFTYNDSDNDEDGDILDRPIDFDQLMQEMENHDNVINSIKGNARP